jgi:hypothetical protein
MRYVGYGWKTCNVNFFLPPHLEKSQELDTVDSRIEPEIRIVVIEVLVVRQVCFRGHLRRKPGTRWGVLT